MEDSDNRDMDIGKILGLDKEYNVVIVGAGNLGRAIANYTNFEKSGFVITGIFDVNPELKGQSIRGVAIRHINELEEFAKHTKIDIAAITVPKSAAVEVADKLVRFGVKAFWNFAHIDLKLPEGVVVESVHLSESLMRISYSLSNHTDIRES